MSNLTIREHFLRLHQDAVLWKAERLWKSAADPDEQAMAMEQLTEMLCCISNETKRTGYIDMLQKQFRIKSSLLKKQVKDLLARREQKKQDEAMKKKFEAEYSNAEDVGLPEGTNIHDALKYGIYEHNGVLYTRGNKGGDLPISNFTMKIVYHSQTSSEKAYRLIAISNVYGFEKMILIDTDDFVSLGSFKKIIARYGDYIFKGTDSDLSRLQEFLQRDEIKSVYVGQMGWDKRHKFYAFANGVVVYNEQEAASFKEVDKYGIVENNNKHFFIPATSEMFSDKDELFVAEKKFTYRQPLENFGLNQWAQLFYQVFGEKAKVAIPFYIGALYRDIIFKQIQRFPMLNLYGPPGAGKGQLAESLMYMFGDKQDPVMLEAGSTKVGMQRKIGFAANALAWLDEYKNSLNKDMIGALKSLYDGQGRVSGKMTNDLQTNVTSVKSAIILSGQDMPTIDPALYTRVIMLAFEEGKFTDAQRDLFKRLKDMEEEGGFSFITTSLLKYRHIVESQFKDAFAIISKQTFKEVANVEIEDRMIINISILLTVMHVLKDVVKFPFTYDEAKAFLISNMEYQHAILVGNTDVSKFWAIVEMLVHQLIIKDGREFMLKDGYIYIKLQLVHPLYLKEMRLRGDANYFGSVDSLRHYLSLNKQVWIEHTKARFPDGSNSNCDKLRYEPLKVDLIRMDTSLTMTEDQRKLAFDQKNANMGIVDEPVVEEDVPFPTYNN